MIVKMIVVVVFFEKKGRSARTASTRVSQQNACARVDGWAQAPTYYY
jgi:hypothetical protein